MSNLILNFDANVQFQGLWSATVNYNLGHIVIFSGDAYLSLIGNNKNLEPDTNPAAWEILNQNLTGPQGPQGVQGNQGPAGPQGVPGPGPTITTPFFSYDGGNTALDNFKTSFFGSIAIYPFNLPYPMMVANIILAINGEGGPLAHLDVGIYDISGALLGHSGVTAAPENLPQTFPLISPITLPAGTYLLALTEPAADATTGAAASWETTQPLGSIFYYITYTISGTQTLPLSGVLPNTISVVAAPSYVSQEFVTGGGTPIFILT